MASKLIIATRGSQLARWQAEYVKRLLEKHHKDLQVEFLVLTTKGDAVGHVPLAKIGGKGLFTEELENALHSGEADIAVHSLKDLPTTLPDGLDLLATPAREDARDLLIVKRNSANSPKGDGPLGHLSEGALLGTSALRRQAQAKKLRPDIEVDPVRGNVDTRLKKLCKGPFDALILAAAGLKRLGLVGGRLMEFQHPELAEDFITYPMSGPEWLGAVSQGAIAIEGRSDDPYVRKLMQPLNDETTWTCCHVERAILRSLEGGCQVPIGVMTQQLNSAEMIVHAGVFSLDGTQEARVSDTIASVSNWDTSGITEALDQAGAREVLRQARAESEDDSKSQM